MIHILTPFMCLNKLCIKKKCFDDFINAFGMNDDDAHCHS